MADLSKLKKRSSLGAPPPPSDASQNLAAPEVAPVAEPEPEEEPEEEGRAVTALRPAKPPSSKSTRKRRIDGRTLRRTGRTVPFATRVSETFDDQFRDIAERDGLKFTELLELSLEAYEAGRSKKKK